MAQGTSFLIVAALAMLSAPTLAQQAVPPATTEAPAKSAIPGPARGFADDALAPASLAEQQLGDRYLAKGELSPARDHFESALVADPRNRPAFLGLARIAEAQNLPGKAAHYYGEALSLEPGDQATLELQGMAYLKRGAARMAEDNIDKLKILCGTESCPPAEKLASAIAAQKILSSSTGSTPAGAATGTNATDMGASKGENPVKAPESKAPGSVTPD